MNVTDQRSPCAVLVDDDPGVRSAVSVMLEELGYRVLAAKNGRDALALVQRDEPDIALIDLALPDMGGIGLAEALRAKRPDLPVVLITGYHEAVLWKPPPSPLKVLLKPFRRADLATALTAARSGADNVLNLSKRAAVVLGRAGRLDGGAQ